MVAEHIPLRFAGNRVARLRELTGRVEYNVTGVGTSDAITLLDSLLDESHGENKGGVSAIDLVAADRDRLLAAIYNAAFGDRIDSTLECTRCRQPFDLHFSLDELMRTVSGRKAKSEWRALDDGRLEGPDGSVIRLPTGRDELAVTDLSPDEREEMLLRRCAGENEPRFDRNALEEAIEKLAPILDLELVARCVECNHEHSVQFDIQTYLLSAIAGERRRLLAEINRIARTYSWSLDEILSLRRTDRRQLVELIEN